MSTGARTEGWTAAHPCPICGGRDTGRGKRCAGYPVAGGRYAACTNDAAGARPHQLCRACGLEQRIHHTTDAAGPGHDVCKCVTHILPLHPAIRHGTGANGHSANGNGQHGSDGGSGPSGGERFGPFTDTRNARRFVAKFGDRALFDFTRGHWRLYRDGVWRLDETKEALRLSKEIVAALPDEVGPDLDEDERRKLFHAALACESTGRLEALLANATAELGCTHERFDPDPWLLNVRNGTIDLHTGELLEHRPERFQSKVAPVDWDPAAECPRWLAFLGRVFNHDEALIDFVRRGVGMSLVGEVLDNAIFVLWGTGANGKSTFLGALQAVLGDYARSADPYLLLEQDRPSHPTNVAELRGVRFLVAVETGHATPLNETLVKQLTGGDVRWARFMFRDAFTYIPSDTPWLATNHKPMITGNSEGIWRRIKPVPFTVSIPREEQDLHLKETLITQEAAGILRWAVAGCLAWQQHGLGLPPSVVDAAAEWRSDTDTMAAFLEDECVRDADGWVLASALYERYVEWCKANGQSRVPSQQRFGVQLGERGFTRGRLGKGRARTWQGLVLRDGGPDGPMFDWSEPSEADAAPQTGGVSPPSPPTLQTIPNTDATTNEDRRTMRTQETLLKRTKTTDEVQDEAGLARARAREIAKVRPHRPPSPPRPPGMPAAAQPQVGVNMTTTLGVSVEAIAALRAEYGDQTGHPSPSDRAYWRGAVFDRAAYDAALAAWTAAKHELWQRLCALEDTAAQERGDG